MDRTKGWRAKARLLRVDFLHSMKGRSNFCLTPFLHNFLQLLMNIPPLTHPRVAEKMIPTKPTQLGLRHALKFIVIGIPDIEDRKKIRVRMQETSMCGVRLGLLIHWALARILNTQGRCDHQHLAQSLLGSGLENHPTHRRIDG